DDDGHRADHGHSAAVRQRRRLVDDREPRRDGDTAVDPRARDAFPTAMIPFKPGALFRLIREVRETKNEPIMVGGTLADQLARELSAGGDPSAVLVGTEPRNVEAFVYVMGDTVTAEDEIVLKRARRERVPILVVAAGREAPDRIPFVLAT